MKRVIKLRRKFDSRASAWVLGGGAARGAAQVGVMAALLERGILPPSTVFGTSVGAFDGAVIAARPNLEGIEMLRELWLSDSAREVFRVRTFSAVLSRLSGQPAILSAAPVRRLIDDFESLTECTDFEDLQLQLKVVATDVVAGCPIVFRSGPLAPALLASSAIPGVFPLVGVHGQSCADGGIVENLPIGLAVRKGYGRVLGVGLMAGAELSAVPSSWSQLLARALRLTLHHRLLSDFERLRNQARVVVICPVTPPEAGWDMDRSRPPARCSESVLPPRRAWCLKPSPLWLSWAGLLPSPCSPPRFDV